MYELSTMGFTSSDVHGTTQKIGRGESDQGDEERIMAQLRSILECEDDAELQRSFPMSSAPPLPPRGKVPLASRFVAGGSYADVKRLNEIVDYILDFHDADPHTAFLSTDLTSEFVSLSKERLEHEANTPVHHHNPMYCVKLIKAVSVAWS